MARKPKVKATPASRQHVVVGTKGMPIDNSPIDFDTDVEARLKAELESRTTARRNSTGSHKIIKRKPVVSTVETKGRTGVQGALVNAVFQHDIELTLKDRAASLYEDFVLGFGAERAAREWKEMLPPHLGKGHPKGPRNPDKDRALLLWFRQFEACHPGLSGRPIRMKCAEHLWENFRRTFGNSVEAIEKQLDRLLENPKDKN